MFRYLFWTTLVFAKPVTTTFDRLAFTLTGPWPCNILMLPIFMGSITPTFFSRPSIPIIMLHIWRHYSILWQKQFIYKNFVFFKKKSENLLFLWIYLSLICRRDLEHSLLNSSRSRDRWTNIVSKSPLKLVWKGILINQFRR